MKVNVFKVLGMVGTLAAELNKIAADGNVTVFEAIDLSLAICGELGIKFDRAELVSEFSERMQKAIADRKLTLAEIVDMAEILCRDLNIALDKGSK